MNLRHIEFVVSAAEERSFSRAAERCHVTQPTLSNGIALMEAELGGQLFVRTTRKVELSRFGEQVLPLVEALFRAHGELKSGVRAFHEPSHRMIRIGLSPVVDVKRVTEVLEPYERSANGCKTFFKECFLADLETRLYGAQFDLIIAPRSDGLSPSKSIVRVPFYEEDLYYLPRPEAAHDTGPVTLKELAQETFVLCPDGCGLTNLTRGLFRKAGIRVKEYPGQALSYQVMQEWADLGIGAAIVPLSKLNPQHRARARRLMTQPKRPARVEFEVSWMRRNVHPRHVGALHEHFRTRVPQLVQGSQR